MNEDVTSETMNEASPRLGFYAAVACFIAIASYGAVQIAQIVGAIGYPLADILIYAASITIAPPFLLTMLAFHDTVAAGRRLWTQGALAFGSIYVTFAALMYTVQLSVVIPTSLERPATGLLGVAPQSLFWDIDGLAYIAMGISTTFAGLALSPAGPGRWARVFLLANGAMTPIIAFIYLYPHFSIAILLLGSPWLITASGSLLTLAAYFRRLPNRAHGRLRFRD